MKIHFNTDDIKTLEVEIDAEKKMPEKIHELSLAISTIVISFFIEAKIPVFVQSKFGEMIMDLVSQYLGDWHTLNEREEFEDDA